MDKRTLLHPRYSSTLVARITRPTTITTAIFFFLAECRGHALGMENNILPNSAMTASSFWSIGHESWRARLNNVPYGHVGSWTGFSNQGEWLQIDLGKETMVTKLATQGRPSMDQWVKSYKILFSSDGLKWEKYKENDAVKVIEF